MEQLTGERDMVCHTPRGDTAVQVLATMSLPELLASPRLCLVYLADLMRHGKQVCVPQMRD